MIESPVVTSGRSIGRQQDTSEAVTQSVTGLECSEKLVMQSCGKFSCKRRIFPSFGNRLLPSLQKKCIAAGLSWKRAISTGNFGAKGFLYPSPKQQERTQRCAQLFVGDFQSSYLACGRTYRTFAHLILTNAGQLPALSTRVRGDFRLNPPRPQPQRRPCWPPGSGPRRPPRAWPARPAPRLRSGAW